MAAPCVSPEAVSAEAAMQFHAELRVTGLTCHEAGGSASLFPLYQQFTMRNGTLLKSYQDTMLSTYKKNGSTRLHARETEIENQVSLAAAQQGTMRFCTDHVPVLHKMANATDSEVRAAIGDYAGAHPPEKICMTAGLAR